jgi:hypothetical protein
MNKISSKAKGSGLTGLALSFVLPHENKPMRLPVVPAALTALLNVMSDGTIPVTDGTARKAFLCRDPAYPLWVERNFENCANALQSSGSVGTWIVPNRSNSVISLPVWDRVETVTSTATVDGISVLAAQVSDYAVLGTAPGTLAFFIPPGSLFEFTIDTAATGGGSGIEVEIVCQVGGEEFVNTILTTSTTGGHIFQGFAASATALLGSLTEGFVPVGFSYVRALRTTNTAPNASTSPNLKFGWTTGGSIGNPSNSKLLWAPFGPPPEFNNSTLPYGRTRLNSSAALFTNVSAALSKEGTILAARLKPSVVDPWLFNSGHLNSTHPSLRYYGPMEKGLYTYTSPSGNLSMFSDAWTTMPSDSAFNPTAKPLFDYKDIGVYNAVVFTDLGSSDVGTQLAVSCYAHLEFETTSSLFTPGVSTLPLEMLHAAEVALLKFGHFHENPLHWAVLANAARNALNIVGPMVAPYLRQAALGLIAKGATYLSRRVSPGDRSMPQAALTAPQTRKPRPKPKAAKRKIRK